MTKVLSIEISLGNCPKCYTNFYNHVTYIYKENCHFSHMSEMLDKEHAKLKNKKVSIYDVYPYARQNVNTWYLEFDSDEDYMQFVLKWS
jgi:hypothetical protein